MMDVKSRIVQNDLSALARYWAIIVTLITWIGLGLGGYYSLRTEIAQSRTERQGQVDALKQGQEGLEKAQLRATEEQNRRLASIESDVKQILRELR